MRVGVPKEIKIEEYRVGLVPGSVRALTAAGHTVFVQTGAGAGIGATDDDYRVAGAEIVDAAATVFERADLIVKVKEPQPIEIAMLRADQTLFTYLHLAPDPRQTDALIGSGCTAIAYETVTDRFGELPLLAPMSEVAGRVATQVAAHYLAKPQGGAGVLMGGVPGVDPATVVILGAGAVGQHAMQMAVGLGARVIVLNRGRHRLEAINTVHGGRVVTRVASPAAIERSVVGADAVIGAALAAGAAAPKLVSADQIARMRPGSVAVDVSIDQGGCFETSRPTTHADPVYVQHGVVHYCVTNMPGAFPRTSAFALNNATLPFTLALANLGSVNAMRADPHLLAGLNVHRGRLTHPAVAQSLGREFTPAAEALIDDR